jgi:hypothetical protein
MPYGGRHMIDFFLQIFLSFRVFDFQIISLGVNVPRVNAEKIEIFLERFIARFMCQVDLKFHEAFTGFKELLRKIRPCWEFIG